MSLKLPEILPVGVQGWKKRETERMVLEFVNRSTTPQSGWTIYQKFKKKKIYRYGGRELSLIMFSLYERGYLEKVGFDKENDLVYKIPTEKG